MLSNSNRRRQNPVALKNIGWKYYLVINIIIIITIAVVYFTYPETSKITLEEVSVIFDGKHAVKNDILQKMETNIGEEDAEGAEDKKGAVEIIEREHVEEVK
jgi:Tfp pilus assembly protein PilO